MLILTRRIGESVYIGDEVRMTVLGVRGTQVRLGINAPKDIPVHREDIYYKIKQEQGGAPPGNAYAQEGEGNEGAEGDEGNIAEGYDDEQRSPEEPDPHNS